jgi:hypothetical protein
MPQYPGGQAQQQVPQVARVPTACASLVKVQKRVNIHVTVLNVHFIKKKKKEDPNGRHNLVLAFALQYGGLIIILCPASVCL